MKAASLLIVALAFAAGGAVLSEPLLAAQAPRAKTEAKRRVGPDRSTPESTVRSFAELIAKGQVSSAASCVEGKPVYHAYRIWDEEWQKPDGGAPHMVLSEVKTRILRGTATVSYKLKVTTYGVVEKSDVQKKIQLRKARDGWLIVPLSLEEYLKRARNFEEVDQLRQLATLTVNPELMTLGFAKARTNECRSNMKQLSTAALMLAQAKNDRLALKPDRMRAALDPYLKSPTLFRCPDDESGSAATSSYTFNRHLSGVNVDNIKTPDRTVLFYEGTKERLSFRHGGEAIVAFADGHVTAVGAAGIGRLIWKP